LIAGSGERTLRTALNQPEADSENYDDGDAGHQRNAQDTVHRHPLQRPNGRPLIGIVSFRRQLSAIDPRLHQANKPQKKPVSFIDGLAVCLYCSL
jgi:hypothetical protein